MDVSDRRMQVQLTPEAKIASDSLYIRAIFAVVGFVSALGRGSPRPAGLPCLLLLAAPPPHAAMAADDVQRRALRQRCEVVQVVFCWFKSVLVVVAVQRDANALRPAASKYILRRRVGVEKPQCRLASLFLDRQRGYICAHVREQRHPEGHTCPTLARHMQGPVLLFFSHAHWHIDHPFQMYQPCASLYL